MRGHSKHIQMTRDEAIAAILGACDFHPAVEEVGVSDSIGRVLAEDAVAQLDMPNSLTCAMDSVAVHWADFEAAAKDGETAGIPDTSAWKRGVDWQFANTGVGMPEGFDTAVVVEHATISEDEQHVTFDSAPSHKGAGTIAPGSRMHKGDVLVKAGTLVTPLLAAHIASGNNVVVRVVAKPKVAFLPTGNELVPAGGEIPRGKNIETNSIMMKGKIEQWGGEAILYPITPDKPDAIEAALRKAATEADIVVLNAGSSKGSDDWSLEVLERIGKVLYHQTNHGPGHHSSCSVLDGTPVIGISGPPGGAAFTTDFYLRPAMQKFLGQNTDPVRVPVRLAEDFPAGGPHAGHASKPDAKGVEKLPGEKRPLEKGPFMGIRQMCLSVSDDGVIEARPIGSVHAAPPLAETADAYYGLVSGPGLTPPHAGDIIEVDLRPERGADHSE